MAGSRNKRPELLAAVGDFLADRLSATQTVCVGLSGGCDSVVLLHLLSRLGLGHRLSALHVHHGLSPNADAWAGFCQVFAATCGVDCRVQRVQVELGGGLGLEAAARAARYQVFLDASCDVLCLAHHAGDQAETLLFNLLRGSGVAGAAAMPPERPLGSIRLLRPLLKLSRLDLEDYARDHGLAWIEDESNADQRHARNFLRHAVMPVLAQRFPAVESVLGQAAEHFAEAAGLLDVLAAEDWSSVADGQAARLEGLRRLSLPRLKNLLRFRLRQLGWRTPASPRLQEFALQLMQAAPDRHPRLDLPDGTLLLSRGRLRWLAPDRSLD